MKKLCNIISLVVALAVIAFIGLSATQASAGSVYDRDTKTLTAGAGTWTNTFAYSAIELKRIWIEGSTVAANTVTVTRVTSPATYTQAVGAIAFASGSKGNTATFTAAHLKAGDKLVFASAVGSNSVAMIEFEVQQH